MTRLPCTAVIAAKNEAPAIAAIVRGALLAVEEVIVVDGHSTDGTAALAAAEGARVLTDHSRGKGEALRVGAAAAGRRAIVFLDADGSHDPADIPRLVEPLLAGRARLVIASRLRGGSDEFSGDWNMFVRLMAGQIITLGINWRFGSRLSDSQNGFRAIGKADFEELGLREPTHTIEQEMTMKALRRGWEILEIPAHEYKRRSGNSHIRLRSAWWRYLVSWLRGMLGV